MRHAKSSWDDHALRDFERPLNERGFRDAPEMGIRMAGLKPNIDLIISSTALRAVTTAGFVAEALGYSESEIEKEPSIYQAGVDELLEIVNQTPNDINTLMLFGHNPGFTDFCDYLTGAGIFNLPTCGLCHIEFDIDDWNLVSAHTGNLKLFDFPKKEKSKEI